MSSLSDKLKSLGVKTGTSHLAPPQPVRHTIDTVVAGSFLSTPRGEAFVSEQIFDEGYLHGWADDSEFQIRGRLAGFRSLHVPGVSMLHDDVQHGTERALGQFVNRYRLLFTVYSRRSLLLLSPSLLVFEIVALFGASLKSMAGLRLRAMADTIRGWPELLQQRRRCQRTRRVRDGQLLVGGPFQLPAAVMGSPLVSWAQRVLGRAFDLNWRLVRRWL